MDKVVYFSACLVLFALVQVALSHNYCRSGRPVYTPKGALSCNPMKPYQCPGYTVCEPTKGKYFGYCCHQVGCPYIKKRFCKGGRRDDRHCKADYHCKPWEVCCTGPCGRVCMKAAKIYNKYTYSSHYLY